MDFDFSPRQKELSRKAREFCDQVLVPLELITDEHGELPMDRREAVKTAVRDWKLFYSLRPLLEDTSLIAP